MEFQPAKDKSLIEHLGQNILAAFIELRLEILMALFLDM